MTLIFNLPKKHNENAYNLINNLINSNSSLNLSLIFEKYVNKFVTGYFDGEWIDGSQSEIKRQIYLLKKERINVLNELKKISQTRKDLDNLIKNLEECNIDSAIKSSKKLKNLNKYLLNLAKTKLSISTSLIDKDLYNSYLTRRKFILDNLKKQKYIIKENEFELNSRLAINLGAASVYETSILFNRNYSFPYIPGSAVKGVTRLWAIHKFAEELRKSGKENRNTVREVAQALEYGKELKINIKEITFKQLIKIFGTQNQQGGVLFFDALPVIDEDEDLIVLDIINVHYKKYYQEDGKNLELGDWMIPEPVFFLAVEKKIKFRFAVASKDESLTDITIYLLQEALKDIGIGAKTSVGYGYFEVKT